MASTVLFLSPLAILGSLINPPATLKTLSARVLLKFSPALVSPILAVLVAILDCSTNSGNTSLSRWYAWAPRAMFSISGKVIAAGGLTLKEMSGFILIAIILSLCGSS